MTCLHLELKVLMYKHHKVRCWIFLGLTFLMCLIFQAPRRALRVLHRAGALVPVLRQLLLPQTAPARLLVPPKVIRRITGCENFIYSCEQKL